MSEEETRLNKLDKSIISVLKETEIGLTLAEISQKTGETEKKVFKGLRKLFQRGIIESRKDRRYALSKHT
jgi:DNA-binding IclR family transcriptional regulator